MGCPGRGFSSHRSGFVTRTCIKNILENHGKKLSKSTVEAVLRWGGWQAVTGAMTVMRTYARRVIDEHLCGYGLCGPHDINDNECLIRKKKYYGIDKRPVAPIIDCGRNRDPLQIRMYTWRCQKWLEFQNCLNELCSSIMASGCANSKIMPVRRYVEFRKVLNMYIKLKPNKSVVRQYESLLGRRQEIWMECLKESRQCATSMYRALPVEVRDPGCECCLQLCYSDMVAVDIGGVKLQGGLDRDGLQGFPHSFTWLSCDACNVSGCKI
jgi:hypothetical protein